VVERTAGPFEYYQEIHGGVNGDTIRADAQDPGLKAETIQALASELEGDSQKVASQLSGDITAESRPIRRLPPRPPRRWPPRATTPWA
jgi:hypothetical protein